MKREKKPSERQRALTQSQRELARHWAAQFEYWVGDYEDEQTCRDHLALARLLRSAGARPGRPDDGKAWDVLQVMSARFPGEQATPEAWRWAAKWVIAHRALSSDFAEATIHEKRRLAKVAHDGDKLIELYPAPKASVTALVKSAKALLEEPKGPWRPFIKYKQ